MTKIEPQFFYKYRGVDENSPPGKDSQLDYLIKQIKDDQLYFPKAAEFNDPFDCAPVIERHSPSLSFEQFEQLLIEHLLKTGNKNTIEVKRQAKQTAQNSYRQPLPPEFIQEQLNLLDNVRMYCVSATHKSILMWSHYASNHQGVCLEYERDGHFAEAWPVTYQSNRPTQFIFDTNDIREQVKSSLLTKHKDWEYEEEWRVIENENPQTIYPIDEKSLKRIILGAYIKDTIKEKIINSANQRKYPPAIVQAKLCERTYSIIVD